MESLPVVLSALAFLSAFLWAVRTPSNWQKLIQQAAKDCSVEPLIAELLKRPPLVQPRFYDEAMEYLHIQNPEVAVRLTMVFVPNNTEHKLSQKWLKKLHDLKHQPPLLTSEFLEQYTRTNCSTAAG
jgi:hypothetical protein